MFNNLPSALQNTETKRMCLKEAAERTYGDPKRLFSFRLSPGGLEQLSGAAEAYLLTQLERGFRTLDFYKELAAPFAVPTKQE